MRTIGQQFRDAAASHPGAVLFDRPGLASLTYGETADLVGRIASALAAAGVQPGDRIAVQVEKSVEAVALYLASLQIGAVFVPLNPAYTPPEVAYFLADASPRVFVAAPGVAAADAPVVLTLGTESDGILMEAARSAPALTDAVARGADDPAAILYTSGTTGRSKGAVLTQANLATNTAALVEAWRYTAADSLIHALPIFHTHGLFVAINMTLAAGAGLIWLDRFDADRVIDQFDRATVLMGVPTFYTRLLLSDRLTREAAASMRLFVSGSAPLLAEDHRAFEARTGHAILERYGMTETGMITSNPYDGPRRPGTVGRHLPGIEVRVTDPDSGAALPAGEIGMVEVRGPNVFAGYWKMPEKTASEFRGDDFFVTGDLGQMDEQGVLAIVGRQKDLVISGGFNVYPREVEALIDAIPGIVESAVIGLPHPDLGEAVTAVVVPEAGAVVDESAILAALAGQLARFKQPRAVVQVDALPRNAMGKVQKAALREQFRGRFYRE